MQILETFWAEDPDKGGLIFNDPSGRREATGRAVDTLAWDVLLKDHSDQTGEQTLEEEENVGNGRTYFADRFKRVAVENHLPLDASVGRKEGAGMNRQLQLERWTRGETRRRTPDGGILEGKEHARVTGTDISPLVFVDELAPEMLKPRMGTRIRCTERIRRRERHTGALGPLVHVLDVG